MDSLIATPRGSINIRPAREVDAQNYRKLRLEALLNHPGDFSADYATNFGKPMEKWVERLSSLGSQDMIYLAIRDEKLIGMCGIFLGDSPKTQHNATLWGVYVRPEWRGLKIAEGMILHCLDWARTQGATVATLGVVTTNSPAIRCYARCGFKVYGIEPQALYYHGVMYDFLLMSRILQHMDRTSVP